MVCRYPPCFIDPAQSGSCTNPAALGGGNAPLHAYLSSTGRTITGPSAVKAWAEGKTVDTPFVSVPGLLTGECKNGRIAFRFRARDVNLVMGNLLTQVEQQTRAYLARK